MINNMKSITQLAQEFKMNKANLHKLIRKLEIDIKMVRDPKAGNQKVAMINLEGIKILKEYRSDFNQPEDKGIGMFYLLRLLPDIEPNRVKFGYTTDIKMRLKQLKTVCPQLETIKTWNCKSMIEQIVILIATTKEDKRLSAEVFNISNIDKTISRIDLFFSMLED